MFDAPHLIVGACFFGIPLLFLYLAVKIVRKAWK
jgi:hypothetical protein